MHQGAVSKMTKLGSTNVESVVESGASPAKAGPDLLFLLTRHLPLGAGRRGTCRAIFNTVHLCPCA